MWKYCKVLIRYLESGNLGLEDQITEQMSMKEYIDQLTGEPAKGSK
ncbi:hypothetical protein DCCM_2791 [Desulfocucumis palustris]|uniref:Uncharacterized protein n=1 Tax=Desulfocucumis palustris TaxID=1898651 RepID=A0A2L2XBT9_9FIRM|nr:hypothetical protein DCCM_2791 [Desulfocucumis palustris]